MKKRRKGSLRLDPRLSHFRRNISSCLKLYHASGAEETLRVLAVELKRHEFVASVRTYLLVGNALVCMSEPGLAHDLSVLNQAQPAVLALFKKRITISHSDGSVELAAAIGGSPAPTAVVHVVLAKANADALLLVWHLFQAASVLLRVPQVGVEQGVTDDGLAERRTVTAREGLYSTVIHEIKNSLAAILAHLDVLRLDRGGDPLVASHLKVLIPQVHRLAGILDAAWTFARAPGEGVEAVDVGENINVVVELVSYHYRPSGVEFELDIPEALQRVTANPQRLQQVWLNYFNNAFHAIRTKGPEGGKIRVKARHESDLRRLSVEIADTGAGMDEKTLALVREISLRGGESAGTFATGLRESARILAEHGGGFEITSEPGVGTTVRVHLSCAEVQDRPSVETQEQQSLEKEES